MQKNRLRKYAQVIAAHGGNIRAHAGMVPFDRIAYHGYFLQRAEGITLTDEIRQRMGQHSVLNGIGALPSLPFLIS